MPSSLDPLADRLGLAADSELLTVAVTHSSYAAEHGCPSNERLEFLGDAVVDLAIADLIVREYPTLDEGSGSLVRSRVVNEAALARAATRLGLSAFVRVGRGEVKSRGLERASLLADSFEAVVAALYLERGYESARDFVQSALADDVREAARRPDDVDPKTQLRQWAESTGRGTPQYVTIASGPAHDTRFEATVLLDGRVCGRGHGRSKKSSELRAARAAWEAREDA
ncbi:MAG: ribonuclease III [Acidimicrobiales bacterium]